MRLQALVFLMLLTASTAMGTAAATTAPPTRALSQFLSADRRLWCVVGQGPSATVYCGSMKPVRSALLHRNGRTTVCGGVGCVQNWNPRAPVLRAGQVNQLGGFRCVSATAGVTCTVSVPGTARGRGFRMTRAGITRIAP